MIDSPATATRPSPLAVTALALGVVAVLLAALPWVGVGAALLAVAVSALAWRRAHRSGYGLGLAHSAVGVALCALAISGVWTAVASVVPSNSDPTLDCSQSDLSPADQIRCDQPVQQ